MDIGELIAFHKQHGKLATVTAVRPPARFGGLELAGDRVRAFAEKNQTSEGWINGGFFVFRPTIFEDLLAPEIYARMEENIWKFPGFNLQERPVRVYPYYAAAHIMGYVGEVDSAILRRYSQPILR